VRDGLSFGEDQIASVDKLDLAHAEQNAACELVELFEERIDFMDEFVLLAILLERHSCFLFFGGLLEFEQGVQFVDDGVVFFLGDLGYL
jgi:hypothetical protein